MNFNEKYSPNVHEVCRIKIYLSPFPSTQFSFSADRSNAVPLLPFFFVYMPFIAIVLLSFVTVCSSRKHAYIILTPLKHHFYIVKLGFTGVYIIFLISAQKHRLWVLVRTASSRRF